MKIIKTSDENIAKFHFIADEEKAICFGITSKTIWFLNERTQVKQVISINKLLELIKDKVISDEIVVYLPDYVIGDVVMMKI